MARTFALAAAVLALATLVQPAARAGGPGILVAHLSALAYETAPDGSADPSSELFTVGNRSIVIGHVTEFGPDLEGVVDLVANEYTVVIDGASFVERLETSDLIIGNLDNQWRFRIFEDSKTSGTAALLPPGMPTSAIPASFVDGTEILAGLVIEGVAIVGVSSLDGLVNGRPDYDGGTHAPMVPEGSNVYHELLGDFAPSASPPGYPHAVELDLRYNAGLPAHEVTWGQVKSRYR